MIRVLVADDQALVRAGLSALLDAEPDLEVVGTAADGVEALPMARELVPDVACLDTGCRDWTASRSPGRCAVRRSSGRCPCSS